MDQETNKQNLSNELPAAAPPERAEPAHPDVPFVQEHLHDQMEAVTGLPLSKLFQSKLGDAISMTSLDPLPDGREVFTITVNDPDKWRDGLRQFVPQFYNVWHDLYPKGMGPTDHETMARVLQEYDLGCAEKLVVVANSQQVDGFVLLSEGGTLSTTGTPVLGVDLVTVRQACRGTRTWQVLRDKLLALKTAPTSLVSSTHNPRVLKATLAFAVKHGFRMYFCGHRVDTASGVLSAKEQAILDELFVIGRKLAEVPNDIQEGIPSYCFAFETGAIDWREKDHFPPDDNSPLAVIFRGIQEWVERNDRRVINPIFGMVAVIPADLFQEE